MQKGVDRLV